MEGKKASILSLLVYAFVLTGILLYVRFPSARVEEYFAKKIGSFIPGADITLGTHRYDFPASLIFERVTISREQGREEIAFLENVTISPIVSGIGFKYSLAGDFYGGTLQAGLKLNPVAGSFSMDALELANVKLESFSFLNTLFQREISGFLNFKGSYAGALNEGKDVSLQGTVAVHGGSFPLRQPILSVRNMSMEEFDVSVSYTDGLLNLLDGSVKGPELYSHFSGELNIADNPPELWEVNVTGNMTPQKGYLNENQQILRVVKRLQRQYQNSELPYKVTGSIGNPRFRFGNE